MIVLTVSTQFADLKTSVVALEHTMVIDHILAVHTSIAEHLGTEVDILDTMMYHH